MYDDPEAGFTRSKSTYDTLPLQKSNWTSKNGGYSTAAGAGAAPPAGTVVYGALLDDGTVYKPVNPFEELMFSARGLQDEGEFARAADKYQQAIQLGGGSNSSLAFTYSCLGRCYEKLDNLDKALYFHKKHLDVTQQDSDQEGQYMALANIGVVYYHLGKFTDALASHELCLGMATQMASVEGQMRAFANIGNVYGSMGRFKDAIRNHEHQLRLAVELGDKEAESRAAYNLENDHNSLKHYDVGLQFRNKKMTARSSKPSAAPLGDRKPGSDVRTGWLLKHEGGEDELPAKMSSEKRFCVLRDGVFSYHKTAQMNTKGLRYIKGSEIVSVEECDVNENANNPR